MEMNPICPDPAMCNAAGGLRVAQTRSADSANSCHAKAANEFTSLHRTFSRLTVPWLQKSRTEYSSAAFIAYRLFANSDMWPHQHAPKLMPAFLCRDEPVWH